MNNRQKEEKTNPKSALILVDVQNDFCPGGALPVAHGNEIVPVINELMADFPGSIVATKDWHPQDHMSFASNHPGSKLFEVKKINGQDQCLWPDHCVPYTEGAEFHPDLHKKLIDKTVLKGINPKIDSYSGFLDNDRTNKTELDGYLEKQGVTRVYIMGLATDYCVKATALDAIQFGYEAYLVLDACRGIDKKEIDAALKKMRAEGIYIIHSSWVPMLERSPLLATKFNRCDRSLFNLKTYIDSLWEEPATVGLATATEFFLPLLTSAWNFALKTPDKQSAWDNLKTECNDAINIIKKLAPAGLYKIFGRSNQKPLIEKLEQFAKSAEELSKTAMLVAAPAAHNTRVIKSR